MKMIISIISGASRSYAATGAIPPTRARVTLAPSPPGQPPQVPGEISYILQTGV